MKIVMPMAGRGSRFAKVGIQTPKPLIDVRGRPMYSWAMDGLPLSLATRVIFLCLAEHLEDLALAEDIRARYGHLDPQIIPVREVTEGQACTVLLARELIDDEEPLLIFNADTTLRSGVPMALADHDMVDGLVGVFEAPGDKWSFARVGFDGRVIETAEKRRISNWASTGLYYFSRGQDFVQHADAMIAADERSNGEFYVAPVYNRLIAAGMSIYPEYDEDVWVLGTPEDLAKFEAEYPE